MSLSTLLSLTGCQDGPMGEPGPPGERGPEGRRTLVVTSAEPAGANCSQGGTKFEVGLDANDDGTLSADELETGQTRYVCNGEAGPQGEQGGAGPQGPEGRRSLVATTPEPAGGGCAMGGVKFEFGPDLDEDGTLDVEEVVAEQTRYVCNGLVGPKGDTGAAGPKGDTGAQGPQGLQGPQGVEGKRALVKTAVELAGGSCATGGVKLEAGVDEDADGSLADTEVDASLTRYVCNG
ncbi:MAG TPA: hypothetical protein VLQ93_20320, partial [Myxococcaceae bacterium]|nr:hypothetical protein [Myxococcaceae bacterium]